MGNPFVHIELQTSDVSLAKKFYANLFEWKVSEVPMGSNGNYTMIDAGKSGTGGGMMKNPSPQMPSHWLAYVDVSDLKATLDKAKTLGAKVIMDATQVEGLGSWAIIQDPTGAAVGIFQKA